MLWSGDELGGPLKDSKRELARHAFPCMTAAMLAERDPDVFLIRARPVTASLPCALRTPPCLVVAATDGLGVVLESDLLTQRERLGGQLVAPLRDQTVSIRYVSHHLVQPRQTANSAAASAFKRWLMAELTTF